MKFLKIFLTIFFIIILNTLTLAGTLYDFGTTSGNYSIYVPTTPSSKMIVVLHGSGERGGTYTSGWQPQAEKRGYYILAPNSSDSMGWSGQDIQRIMTLVDGAQKQFNIKHTLLNGASAGGHFALFLGITYYQYFDGIATFMGMVLNSLGSYIQYQTTAENKRPILLIHGKKDDKIPIKLGKENYQFLLNKKYPVTFKEELAMGHEFYTKDCEFILNWFEGKIKAKS